MVVYCFSMRVSDEKHEWFIQVSCYGPLQEPTGTLEPFFTVPFCLGVQNPTSISNRRVSITVVQNSLSSDCLILLKTILISGESVMYQVAGVTIVLEDKRDVSHVEN